MSHFVLFQMNSWQRENYVEKHEFYVSQSKKRLLDQFTDEAIKKEADEVAAASYKERGRWFNPDYDDPTDNAEAAYEDGIWRYELLNELRDQVRLNIIVGFYHNWEKALREWLVNEVGHWHRGEKLKAQIWKVKIDDIFDLFERSQWNIRNQDFFELLYNCSLIANISKHGDGPSLQKLKDRNPDYFNASILDESFGITAHSWTYEDLSISNTHLDNFAEAIMHFWQALPENIKTTKLLNLRLGL